MDRSGRLRSVEDFTQFEQRTAYFNGDHVSAQRKGMNRPDRVDHIPMMAQMQNIVDFPPAPKLAPFERLDPSKATEQELAGSGSSSARDGVPSAMSLRPHSWTTTCMI